MSEYGMDLLPAHIAAYIVVDPETGCWLYGGHKDPDDYASITCDGKTYAAHRFVFERLVGPIPPGLHLDHVRQRGCAYRNCCWPRHLEPVTNLENQRRRAEFHRAKREIQERAQAWRDADAGQREDRMRQREIARRDKDAKPFPVVYAPRPPMNLSGIDALEQIFAQV